MPYFQFSPWVPKCLGPILFPSHLLSASTHVTPCSMANHQALLLNLHSWIFSSSSPPTTHHCRNLTKIKPRPPSRPNPAKIKSQQKPRSLPNHKSNHTHRYQSTKPTKQPKSQNENIESEPTDKKTYIDNVIQISTSHKSCKNDITKDNPISIQ